MPAYLLIVCLVLGLTACSGPARITKRPPVDALEIAFHYMFYSDESAARQETQYYFIAIESLDPPPSLLDRFVGFNPMVSPQSVAKLDCRETGSWTRSLVHRFNSGRGTLFNIESIRRVSKHSYRIDWTFFEWCQQSPRYTFYLKADNDTWSVVARDVAK